MIKFVFHTDRFIKRGMGATTWGPFVFIRPTKAHDAGLLAHELVHVRQFWRNPLFGLWYMFSKKARYKYELEAYREQLTHYPERAEALATLLATKYDLDVTPKEALIALTA